MSKSLWPHGLCSLPDASVHGIFQARILEWAADSFSRGSSQPRDQTRVSCTVDRHFFLWPTREVTKSWGRSPCEWDECLIKDTPETSFALSVTLAYIRNTAACGPGNSSHQMPYLQSILILNFQASWNVRNKCMLFTYPVYSIFS